MERPPRVGTALFQGHPDADPGLELPVFGYLDNLDIFLFFLLPSDHPVRIKKCPR